MFDIFRLSFWSHLLSFDTDVVVQSVIKNLIELFRTKILAKY